jgi:hypothetical protein
MGDLEAELARFEAELASVSRGPMVRKGEGGPHSHWATICGL